MSRRIPLVLTMLFLSACETSPAIEADGNPLDLSVHEQTAGHSTARIAFDAPLSPADLRAWRRDNSDVTIRRVFVSVEGFHGSFSPVGAETTRPIEAARVRYEQASALGRRGMSRRAADLLREHGENEILAKSGLSGYAESLLEKAARMERAGRSIRTGGGFITGLEVDGLVDTSLGTGGGSVRDVARPGEPWHPVFSEPSDAGARPTGPDMIKELRRLADAGPEEGK